MNAPTKGGALDGVRVLVTRPAHQADALCAMIEQRGGIPIRFPAIDILPPNDLASFDDIATRLDQFHLAIFVSPNAVTHALRLLRARGIGLPAQLAIAAIGAGSANALAQHGIAPAIVPARTDSEGLLAMAAMQSVSGRRIVIFRGEGGRGTLADTLRTRGAQVEYAECYRRARPVADARPLQRAFANGEIDVVVLTSADALENLRAMLDVEAAKLAQATLVVVSERLREICTEFGLRGTVRVASAASDDAVVAAIEAWRRTGKTL